MYYWNMKSWQYSAEIIISLYCQLEDCYSYDKDGDIAIML